MSHDDQRDVETFFEEAFEISNAYFMIDRKLDIDMDKCTCGLCKITNLNENTDTRKPTISTNKTMKFRVEFDSYRGSNSILKCARNSRELLQSKLSMLNPAKSELKTKEF